MAKKFSMYGESSAPIFFKGAKKVEIDVKAAEKAARQVNRENVMKEVAEELAKAKANIKLIKSLNSYRTNGYRQWGTDVKTIMAMPNMESGFIGIWSANKDIENQLAMIKQISKRKSDRSVYAYIERLSYLCDNLKTKLDELSNAVSENNILTRFQNRKAVFEKGRRLGLRELISRTYGAQYALGELVDKCDKIAHKGLDAFEYKAD